MSFLGTVASDFMKLGEIPENRKSDTIDFAAVDFESIKASLLEYINAVYPQDYDNFYSSDLGIMLVELVAYMGAVTSFKTDAVANECFINTVKNRQNLIKLLNLVGVKLKGPSSASARGKLTWASAGAFTPDDGVGAFSFGPGDRTYTITSPQDGAPATYTLYKLDSNDVIEGISNNTDTIAFYGASDAGNSASTVFTDMALVEGSLSVEAGTFGVDTIQRIPLTNGPVIEKSVGVFVESTDEGASNATGAYVEVDRLFSTSGATAKVFEVIYDAEFNATLVFGDGAISQNPPANGTYTVSYRVGGGSRGNLVKQALNLVATDSNAKEWRLENSTDMTGGQNAETLQEAKRYGPYTFKTQDRLVTIQDYIAFVNRYQDSLGNSGRATAVTREAYSSANIIDVYLLQKATNLQFQKASPLFKKGLLEAIEDKKMLTDQVVVNDGVARTLDFTVTLRVDKEYKQIEEQLKRIVSNEIITFFLVGNMEFGKDFLKVDLERKIFKLSEVRFATIDNIPAVIPLDMNEILQLNNFSLNIIYI